MVGGIYIHSNFQFESNIFFFFVLEAEKERNAWRTSDFASNINVLQTQARRKGFEESKLIKFQARRRRFLYLAET